MEIKAMTLHEYLKKVAVLWLLNRGCYIVGTEIYIPRSIRPPIPRFPQELTQEQISRHKKYKQYIDVCGVGIQYRSQWEREFGGEPKDYNRVIIRGIEVKTSRSDYRNGFVRSGCNYNYLLTPKNLLKKTDIPDKVGLIEYEENKFSCDKAWNSPFQFKGLRVVKRPVKQDLPDKDFRMITSGIGRKMRPILIETVYDNFVLVKENKT